MEEGLVNPHGRELEMLNNVRKLPESSIEAELSYNDACTDTTPNRKITIMSNRCEYKDVNENDRDMKLDLPTTWILSKPSTSSQLTLDSKQRKLLSSVICFTSLWREIFAMEACPRAPLSGLNLSLQILYFP